MSSRRATGFTLLEVVVAVFVFATVMSALIALVSQNLRRTADARDELHVARLAEGKLRQMLFEAEKGELPDVGTTRASFEGDDADMTYQIDVTPYGVPLPAGTPKKVAEGSRLFVGGEGEPAVRRIVLKVFRADEDPDQAVSFVAFVAEPNEAVEGAEGEGQGESSDEQASEEPPEEPQQEIPE